MTMNPSNTILSWLAAEPRPTPEVQQAAAREILVSTPSMTLFSRHWWWLANRPVPLRRDGVSNRAYLGRHWWRLVRGAEVFIVPTQPPP